MPWYKIDIKHRSRFEIDIKHWYLNPPNLDTYEQLKKNHWLITFIFNWHLQVWMISKSLMLEKNKRYWSCWIRKENDTFLSILWHVTFQSMHTNNVTLWILVLANLSVKLHSKHEMGEYNSWYLFLYLKMNHPFFYSTITFFCDKNIVS